MDAYGLGAWGAVVERTFGDVEVDAHAQGFRACLQHRAWGSLALSVVDSTPACVQGGTHRTSQGYFLFLNLIGHTTVSQGGRSALLGPGDLTAVHQAEPYRLKFDETHRMQVLAVPELDGRCALADHVARCHGPEESALLAAFMAKLAATDETQPLHDGLRLTQDLLALCWPHIGRTAQETALTAWERPLLALIARELCDTELDAHSLGRHLGISARYVQMVLARRGTTLTAYLLEQRLLKAAKSLRDNNTMRISDVALDVGFGDMSHFCRSFRQRFGCSASEWRRAH